ncbi:putative ankyrin repeat protein RF_0950 [Argopecten irradians]|uniref:putative ankyrin repeat protein RF_0950 n=1 Tax=Argopecten irradians TaxID=31199 RepID=UPI0037188205
MADDLYTAVLEQNVDKVQILLETGADPNTDHALEKAVDKCNLDIVTLLIDNGADVNKGNTLKMAASKGSIKKWSDILLRKERTSIRAMSLKLQRG